MSEARLARLLARRMEESGRDRSRPFTVAELRDELLPYPLCRRRLGLTTKAEYDLALLRLLADPALTETDDEVAEAVERELRGPEPKLDGLEAFPEAPIRAGSGFPAPGEPATRSADGGGNGSSSGGRPRGPAPPAPRAVGRERCARCEKRLPALASLRFCPQCGADQHEPRCGACGEAAEPEWRYCPACGEPLARTPSGKRRGGGTVG